MGGEKSGEVARPGAGVAAWAHAVATVAFAGLAAASALTRSVSPVVMGRYSKGLFAYQVLNLAALGLMAGPRRSRWAGAGLVVVSTFLAPINEAVRNLPGIGAALPAVRLLVAWSIVAGEFERHRRERGKVRGFALGSGFALMMLSMMDLALWGWVASTSGFDEDHGGYRDRYALAGVTADDVVLVGDSFVWGHGVAKASRFGDVLERLYRDEGRRVRVYSLGVRGAGPERDIASLARVPEGREAGAVVLAFYPNDLAPRPRAKVLRPIEDATWTLGRSSLTFRALHDLLGRIESPSLEHYHRSVIADFDRDDPTFAGRWAELTDALGRFATMAARRSSSRPTLLILPLMVDFRAYPLAGAHVGLRAAAGRLGYDVLDLLPDFRAELVDGARYRVHPGDNHFDARVHALVAALLKRHLDGRRDTARLGLTAPAADRGQ